MSVARVAHHKTNAVELRQQRDIPYLLKDEPGSHARGGVEEHGPCAPAIALRVVDARHAFDHVVKNCAQPYDVADKMLDWPALLGIGGESICFPHDYWAGANPYLAEFAFMAAPKPSGAGFRYLDHVTHNVFKWNMDRWFDFYSRLFNFRQIRFFDIEGKYTGLYIHALTSPCGRIRIPINEDSGETGQNDEYFKRYKGEGVQHLALGCGKIYSTTEAIAARGLKLMPKPLMAIYALSKIRVGGVRRRSKRFLSMAT